MTKSEFFLFFNLNFQLSVKNEIIPLALGNPIKVSQNCHPNLCNQQDLVRSHFKKIKNDLSVNTTTIVVNANMNYTQNIYHKII